MTVAELFSNFTYCFREIYIDTMDGTDLGEKRFVAGEYDNDEADTEVLSRYGDREVTAWEFDNEMNEMSLWLD